MEQKIIQFIEKNLERGFYSDNHTKNDNLVCPCCEHRTSFFEWYGYASHNYGYEYPDKPYRNCFINFMRHLNAKIRLSGCPKHINLLVELLGTEKSHKILSRMAEKNMLVAIRLKNFTKLLETTQKQGGKS